MLSTSRQRLTTTRPRAVEAVTQARHEWEHEAVLNADTIETTHAVTYTR
ncbi:hypothetical protein ACIOKD_13130 [Streptomyces sp. NPDC087844]